ISSFADKQSSSAFGISSNISVNQQNYSFTDFKFKSILDEGLSDRRMIHSSCLKCPATKTKEEKVAQATAKNKAKPSIYNILCNFAMLSIQSIRSLSSTKSY
ncbi:3452_t:CDS:2, partial [Funneliformis geosporum]